MNTSFICRLLSTALLATALSAHAQISIPDPGLNAAVRAALQKPDGPITLQDMLGLTVLSACCAGINNLEGLEAATNLRVADLHSNALTNAAALSTLPNLEIIDLFENRLTSFALSNSQTNLTVLNLSENLLTECSLPSGLGLLDTIFLEFNQLTNLILPQGLIKLRQLDLSGNALSNLDLPADMTNLVSLQLFANNLTNITLPGTLRQLGHLDLDVNRLSSFALPEGLSNLLRLTFFENQLTNLVLPAGLAKLGYLDLGENDLNRLDLPTGLNSLSFLRISGNALTHLTIPEGPTNLSGLFLRSNQLTNLTLPAGLEHLVQIDVMENSLSALTLPRDINQLATLVLNGNPLSTLVLSERTATNLATLVTSLKEQGVSVFPYPLAAELIRIRQPIGAFQFAISGPPAAYSVLASSNLSDWSVLSTVTNTLGNLVFTDVTANLTPQKFYRAFEQTSPSNMVFIPPTTFTMGSPANELHRATNEGPQTIVTLSRGYWIGKYEVTQAEYLSIMSTNPSSFSNDLSHPVSSVSWPDATNFCAKLTERELAAGRIPAGSRYRLPTEAEWECAARAGTTTRFSFGDDLNYSSVTNHAWINFEGGLTVHPVGQKLPNRWGLYDIEGNVFEWCQDWLGPLPGGTVVDPVGPDTNPIGWRVMRGGAFDFSETSCRSAARSFFPSHPALNDWNLGFRVVLAAD